MKNTLLFSLLAIGLLINSTALLARGGGGCIEQGAAVLTPNGEVPIEQLKIGDTVLTFKNQSLIPAKVLSVTEVEPDHYYELIVNGRSLRLTDEHPVEIAPGVFRMANRLKPNDTIVFQNNNPCSTTLLSIKRTDAKTPAYNLMVSPAGTFLANGVIVHNKGCFLPETLIRKQDGSEVPISSIRPQDQLTAFTADDHIVTATVQQIITHQVNEYRVVKTKNVTLFVTEEHPFFVGNGTFKTLESLKIGDDIFVFDGQQLTPQPIESIESVAAAVCVYNLQTDKPNTFLANGVAVHNKGGGCFPAGTRIQTPDGDKSIEQIQIGDRVTAVTKNGNRIPVRVRQTHTTLATILQINLGSQSLRTTAEHPICLADGTCRLASDLAPGDKIRTWKNSKILSLDFSDTRTLDAPQIVYNLTVDWPHTFIADDIVVHNKGGGGFHGGGYRGGGSHSSSQSSSNNPLEKYLPFVVVGLVILIIITKAVLDNKSENLDFVFSPATIAKKSNKTLKLLEFLAKQDPTVNPDALRDLAKTTFLKLQQCWFAREYTQMKNLMMPDLFLNHCSQLQGMVRNHEINVIENLQIHQIDLVNIRYTLKENQREFTALFTASAKDYYIDDRSRRRLRGDTTIEKFQEFWTFQYLDKTWRLREIEQPKESDILKEDNFFEQFTDTGVAQIYGKDADKNGPSGPWLENNTQTKDTRVERMLNFLVLTDKIWNRQNMLDAARRVFLNMIAAWESGNPAEIRDEDLFPDLADHLRNKILNHKNQNIKLEFRNLCVRKVELILIRNFSDDSKDEFIARIRAHAQKIVQQNNQIIKKDNDVELFEQYLTMGRLDKQWKLKEILSADAGKTAMSEENLDQDSSPQQVQWYYQHKRAL